VNQPEFMLDPNALITGSEYFRTAFEDKFESVSPIDCGINRPVIKNESRKIGKIILESFFICSSGNQLRLSKKGGKNYSFWSISSRALFRLASVIFSPLSRRAISVILSDCGNFFIELITLSFCANFSIEK
jgi:hypothetical protein